MRRCLVTNSTEAAHEKRLAPAKKLATQEPGGKKDSGLAANRTRTQGFGDPYTIHCTTRPLLRFADARMRCGSVI